MLLCKTVSIVVSTHIIKMIDPHAFDPAHHLGMNCMSMHRTRDEWRAIIEEQRRSVLVSDKLNFVTSTILRAPLSPMLNSVFRPLA
nr:hypothetical protein [Sodalis glossinidius]